MTTKTDVLKYINSVFDYEIKNYEDQLKFNNGNKSWGDFIQEKGIRHSMSLIEEMRTYVRKNLK